MATSYQYTTPDPALAAAWAKMKPAERTAYLRQGAVLNVTSAQRQAAKARLVKQAGGQ